MSQGVKGYVIARRNTTFLSFALHYLLIIRILFQRTERLKVLVNASRSIDFVEKFL